MGEHPHGRQIAFSTLGANDIIAISEVPRVPLGPAGVSHFGLNLISDDDFDEIIQQVELAGGRLLSRHSFEQDGRVEQNAYFSDPDGYVIELNTQRALLSRKHKTSFD